MWINYMEWMTHWCTSKLLKENISVIIYWKKVCITLIPKWNEGLKYEIYSLFLLVLSQSWFLHLKIIYINACKV
jgi:hypothetical protein